MTNVIVIALIVGFVALVVTAYIKSKKTRQELINEMQEEILEAPAAVVEKVKKASAKVEEVVTEAKEVVAEVKEAVVEVKQAVETTKQAVKEMVATQEAPAERPKSKRRRGRPANKKENNSTK